MVPMADTVGTGQKDRPYPQDRIYTDHLNQHGLRTSFKRTYTRHDPCLESHHRRLSAVGNIRWGARLGDRTSTWLHLVFLSVNSHNVMDQNG